MLRKIKSDKWKHFFVGIGMGIFLQWIATYFFPHSPWIAFFVVFGCVLVICYGFEVASLVFKRGHYDVMDAVAGIIGSLIGMLLIIAVA